MLVYPRVCKMTPMVCEWDELLGRLHCRRTCVQRVLWNPLERRTFPTPKPPDFQDSKGIQKAWWFDSFTFFVDFYIAGDKGSVSSDLLKSQKGSKKKTIGTPSILISKESTWFPAVKKAHGFRKQFLFHQWLKPPTQKLVLSVSGDGWGPMAEWPLSIVWW